MVKQWVQPPISKYHIYIYTATWSFLLGSHLTSVNLSISTIKAFHWNIRGKLRNPVLVNILYRFNKGINQI